MIHPAGPFLFRRCRPAQGTAFPTALPPAAPLRPWGGVGWGGRVGGGCASQRPTQGPWAGTASVGPSVWAPTVAFRPVTQQPPPSARGAAAVSQLLPQRLPPALFAWDAVFRVVLTRPGGEHASSEPHACRVHAHLHTHVLCAHAFSRARVRAPVRPPCPGAGERVPRIVLPQRARSPAGSCTAPGATSGSF